MLRADPPFSEVLFPQSRGAGVLWAWLGFRGAFFGVGVFWPGSLSGLASASAEGGKEMGMVQKFKFTPPWDCRFESLSPFTSFHFGYLFVTHSQMNLGTRNAFVLQ